MTVNELLSKLEKVIDRHNGNWNARCPAHDDKSPSLSICEKSDGRILIHCHAGCSPVDVMASLGLSVNDLFPERLPTYNSRKASEFDYVMIEIAKAIRAEGGRLTPQQMEQERESWERINANR